MMPLKQVFLWVEGTDDSMFFDRIVKPMLQTRYDYVKIVEYAQMDKKTMKKFFRSMKEMKADHLFIADADMAPCATAKEERLGMKHDYLEQDKTIVVVKEIEGWYLAGLNKATSDRLRVPFVPKTDNLAKQDFDRGIPKKFDSRLDFMLEILNSFSVDTAKKRNKSFAYLARKCGF